MIDILGYCGLGWRADQPSGDKATATVLDIRWNETNSLLVGQLVLDSRLWKGGISDHDQEYFIPRELKPDPLADVAYRPTRLGIDTRRVDGPILRIAPEGLNPEIWEPVLTIRELLEGERRGLTHRRLGGRIPDTGGLNDLDLPPEWRAFNALPVALLTMVGRASSLRCYVDVQSVEAGRPLCRLYVNEPPTASGLFERAVWALTNSLSGLSGKIPDSLEALPDVSA